MAEKSNKKIKYHYDHPENRRIGKFLTKEDRDWIAEKLNTTEKYIYRIFVLGDRTNERAIELANIAIKIKRERDRKAATL